MARHKSLVDAVSERYTVAAFGGTSTLVVSCIDFTIGTPWFAVPHTMTDLLLGGILFTYTVMVIRAAKRTLEMMEEERPLDRLRNSRGEPMQISLAMPAFADVLCHLPATYPDDVNIEEEALKLIAAVNRNVEL